MNKILLIVVLVATVLATDYEEIANIVNRAKTTWTASVPKDVEKYTATLGMLETENLVPIKIQKISDNIPKEFDSSNNWPKCKEVITDIRSQSVCGGCWAFGAVESATDRLCIATNGTKIKRLSDEDVITCCKDCGNGCDGGFPPMAWNYLATHGVPSGGPHGDTTRCKAYSFPLDNRCEDKSIQCGERVPTPKCELACQSTYPIAYEDDLEFFNTPYALPIDELQIQTDLMTHGPMETGFKVYEDFMTYKKGIYQYTTGKNVGAHAVKLVGWGEENGVKYWRIANSWSSTWGEDGYFRILRGVNECNVEKNCISALPRINKN